MANRSEQDHRRRERLLRRAAVDDSVPPGLASSYERIGDHTAPTSAAASSNALATDPTPLLQPVRGAEEEAPAEAADVAVTLTVEA